MLMILALPIPRQTQSFPVTPLRTQHSIASMFQLFFFIFSVDYVSFSFCDLYCIIDLFIFFILRVVVVII
jgi:hypothetical protein